MGHYKFNKITLNQKQKNISEWNRPYSGSLSGKILLWHKTELQQHTTEMYWTVGTKRNCQRSLSDATEMH